MQNTTNTFDYHVDKFADIEILRYRVTGFEALSLQQKQLIYHLSEAAQEGRDILFDQHYEHNLCIRRTLEAIYETHNETEKNVEEFNAFEIYLKRIWFSNGIHHHYSTDKLEITCSKEYFTSLLKKVPVSLLPLEKNETIDSFYTKIITLIYNPEIDKKRVNLADNHDLITSSANHFYKNVTQQEAEDFYNGLQDSSDLQPISYGLNSCLVKENGIIKEKTWKLNGMYTAAIEKIIYHLSNAMAFAENSKQKLIIEKLIAFYQTGNLQTFDEYSILWVKDTSSEIDFLNGFIETYGDPLGRKGSWEAIVNFIHKEATQRTQTISNHAQWFEKHSPVNEKFKKTSVVGVSAKVITNAMLGGDSYPATPIGINLPNSNWIREVHGSKSVTIDNMMEAYHHAASGNGFNEEFMWSQHECELTEKYGYITDKLHTDLHECVGHGSGKMLDGVSPEALKAYGATIEETRADLFGLYFIADPMMVEIGLLPNMDAYKAEYYRFMLNGLMTQLVRIKLGDTIEESHMRNRQLIANWVFEKGQKQKCIEKRVQNNKTYIIIHDYVALRTLFGELLAEIQRIKSEGDYTAAKYLVEKYAIQIDYSLHKEILERYTALDIAPYKGFVNPTYEQVYNEYGEVIDIVPHYTESYTEQMLRYSKTKSYLPTYN